MFSERIGSWKKVTAGCAVFVFILSFVFGIIGGVLIGAVILRALLFAALFAGISLLVLGLIDRFIPELLSSDMDDEELQESVISGDGSGQKSGPARQDNGKNLDITVDDDDELSFTPESGGYEELESLEAAESSSDTSEDASDTLPAQAESAETADEAEDVEVLEEEEVSAVDEDRNLPDIGEFADGFEQSAGAGDDDGLSSIDGSGRDGADIFGSRHETQDLVKAVQTVLKKDQEG
ncbi:MAG: hypothetical protein JEZ04_00315 [Spirochaetales bacterium]|nr:hypothetical protein [Spirochaetales bacterium]